MTSRSAVADDALGSYDVVGLFQLFGAATLVGGQYAWGPSFERERCRFRPSMSAETNSAGGAHLRLRYDS